MSQGAKAKARTGWRGGEAADRQKVSPRRDMMAMYTCSTVPPGVRRLALGSALGQGYFTQRASRVGLSAVTALLFL